MNGRRKSGRSRPDDCDIVDAGLDPGPSAEGLDKLGIG
jgi:hypothetical protein